MVGNPERKVQLRGLYVNRRAVLRTNFKEEKHGLESLSHNRF
jgi:hypothetical protein